MTTAIRTIKMTSNGSTTILKLFVKMKETFGKTKEPKNDRWQEQEH